MCCAVLVKSSPTYKAWKFKCVCVPLSAMVLKYIVYHI